MKETSFHLLKKRLKPGKLYRRQELAPFSSNIDRHLKKLVEEGVLQKLINGLYLCPQTSQLGNLPPDDEIVLRSFLKSDKFLLYSPNAFNALGLGTTQLYHLPVVLNQKRHGELSVGGKRFFFERRLRVPKKMTKEILLVEFLNHLNKLAERPNDLFNKLSSKLMEFDSKTLQKAVRFYGTYSTQKLLNELYTSRLEDAA